MIAGLIPAAGHSRRMGRVKLALPLGGRPLLAHVVEALRQGGVEPVLVVLGPHVAELADIARDAGAVPLILDEETPDMRTTIERGLSWLEMTCEPAPEAWLLSPADHPTLDRDIVKSVHRAFRESGRGIVIPMWQGKRGHPTLIAWRHVEGIRRHPAGEGLNSYLRQQAEDTLELPAEGAGVIEDIDTPEDYERLLARFTAGQEPEV